MDAPADTTQARSLNHFCHLLHTRCSRSSCHARLMRAGLEPAASVSCRALLFRRGDGDPR
jgi:hypothetical protein